MQAQTMLSTSGARHGPLCSLLLPLQRQTHGLSPCRQRRRCLIQIKAQGTLISALQHRTFSLSLLQHLHSSGFLCKASEGTISAHSFPSCCHWI